MNEKISQLLQLARELHAATEQPKGVRDFDLSVNFNPAVIQPFTCTAYLDDGAYTFVMGCGETPEAAVAEMKSKIPPPVTAQSLREKAAAIIAQAEKLEQEVSQ